MFHIISFHRYYIVYNALKQLGLWLRTLTQFLVSLTTIDTSVHYVTLVIIIGMRLAFGLVPRSNDLVVKIRTPLTFYTVFVWQTC